MEIPRIKLKPLTRSILLEWLFIIVFVNVMMYGYYFFSWWGLEDYLDTYSFYDYLHSPYIHLEMIIQGTMFGLLFGIINYLSDKSALRRKSFGMIILIKTILYSSAMILSQYVVLIIYRIFNVIHVEVLDNMRTDISVRFIISVVIYFVVVIVFLNFILQISRKFGFKELWSIIIGKYHKPTQERRIFLFLDMKDSTGNAERLGHITYSQLIQSCIHDLTDLIIRYKAEVYQYVGDEVVLSWPLKTGVKDQNFINLFYAFEQRLKDKDDYYQKKYNTTPIFKAGADEGTITVAEVGDIKREIAYHGDVLHTAARLEKLCNQLENKLLITENLRHEVNECSGITYSNMGKYTLRGKEIAESIFAISRSA